MVVKHKAFLKERYQYCVEGIAPEVNLRVNNADINTLKTALLTRMYMCEVGGVFVEPPLPSLLTVEATLADFKSRLCVMRATPETRQTIVGMYTGRKRTIYENACRSLLRKPLERKDAVSVAFVKPEKVPPNKAPRCIQPRDPRYNLEVGCFLKPIEHRVYRTIANIFGDGPTVMKGYNVEAVARIIVGKWNSFHRPCAIGLDATKFDMHVSPAMLRWEHSIYEAIFNGNQTLKKLLRWQMYNKGLGYCKDGRLKYSVTGKRFSGDMNTAMGNCIIMCGMVWCYARERGINIKLVNNGDDCVVFMEQSDEREFTRGLNEWFLALGFRMVAEPTVHDVQRIEFCQMHPIRTSNGWTMVRNVPKALAKDSMCLIPLRTPKEMKEWMGAVGEGGSVVARGVPVLQEFYKLYCRTGSVETNFGREILRRSGYLYYSDGVQGKDTTVSAEARYDTWLAWGILPDHQTSLEEGYANGTVAYGNCTYNGHNEYSHLVL